MNYYKVVSPRGGVVCVTHIENVAQRVLKMFPSNYNIEFIKGEWAVVKCAWQTKAIFY